MSGEVAGSGTSFRAVLKRGRKVRTLHDPPIPTRFCGVEGQDLEMIQERINNPAREVLCVIRSVAIS
jgi:hypothetical protein